MLVVVCLSFILASLIVVVHFITKIIDWIKKVHYEKYSNNSAEFISDLYKLKMKWAKRGEFMYCKAIDSVIGAEMMEIGDEIQPETEYGKDFLQKMSGLLKEDLRNNSKALD